MSARARAGGSRSPPRRRSPCAPARRSCAACARGSPASRTGPDRAVLRQRRLPRGPRRLPGQAHPEVLGAVVIPGLVPGVGARRRLRTCIQRARGCLPSRRAGAPGVTPKAPAAGSATGRPCRASSARRRRTRRAAAAATAPRASTPGTTSEPTCRKVMNTESWPRARSGARRAGTARCRPRR